MGVCVAWWAGRLFAALSRMVGKMGNGFIPVFSLSPKSEGLLRHGVMHNHK